MGCFGIDNGRVNRLHVKFGSLTSAQLPDVLPNLMDILETPSLFFTIHLFDTI